MKTKRAINTKLKMMVAQRRVKRTPPGRSAEGISKGMIMFFALKWVATPWVFTVLYNLSI